MASSGRRFALGLQFLYRLGPPDSPYWMYLARDAGKGHPAGEGGGPFFEVSFGVRVLYQESECFSRYLLQSLLVRIDGLCAS